MEKSIVYQNRKFTTGTAGRYYFGRVKGANWSLHRYKYTIERGPIPKGWHIHHIDGDFLNNDISNLKPIEPNKHFKMHPTSEETLKKWQAAGIKVAAAWHSSQEGVEGRLRHYENVKSKMHQRYKANCSFCNKETETNAKTKLSKSNVFCSNNCKSSWRRKNNPDKKNATCPTCGDNFETLKYTPNTYCSRKCKPAPNPKGRAVK